MINLGDKLMLPVEFEVTQIDNEPSGDYVALSYNGELVGGFTMEALEKIIGSGQSLPIGVKEDE